MTAIRQIITHKVNGLNDAIAITPMDDLGPGGAHHHYRLALPGPGGEPMACHIHFQNGPIQEAGFNGFSHEALIAVVIDRLQCFQKGPYAGRENALALTKLEEAMHWLHHRTRERMARGVEGTSAK